MAATNREWGQQNRRIFTMEPDSRSKSDFKRRSIRIQ